jgi:hypothetical protein
MQRNPTHKIGIKIITNMRAQERINLLTGIDKYMRIRKESMMFNSISQ